ncbi:hypothetical protein DCS_03147 [Drechmeria coniospora]|uniref:Glycosyltransferase family 25 protein n=1 Tax=Drechmeria coniospora TaxID=98403 RepID=A0A151GY85_DRECN|nr:hypothetical protein DCS_03147 [Drechmeria coniospora]KYK62002.1 hypothetical protein DCS_03147 [Drechmeria coniospora]
MGRHGARHTRLAVVAAASVLMLYAFLARRGARLLDWAPGHGMGSRRSPAPEAVPRPPRLTDESMYPSDLDRVTNRTLGFEKIMVVGLRERSDKRDAIALMASLTGIDVDWVDGVPSSSISEKAVPFGIDVDRAKDNFLGSWRGHMDAIRRVVEMGYSSALIMEDDVDWDVHVKSQLKAVGMGARELFGESSRAPHSPYGDTWDVLWPGHCGELFPEFLDENLHLDEEQMAKITAKYIVSNDETVPPYRHVSDLVDWSAFPPLTRIVHLSAGPICTFAYAVSQAGARKLLHALSLEGLHMAFDNSLAQVCRDSIHDLAVGSTGGYDMKCVSVSPTMMFHHRPRGRIAGDSDIQSPGKDGGVREKGITESIKWSVRLNSKNMLTGRPLESQYEGEAA